MYLRGVKAVSIGDFGDASVQTSPRGGALPGRPADQRIWVASSQGTGRRTLTWFPKAGAWTIVVMNTDARRGVEVRADVGATVPVLPWIAGALLVAGVVFKLGGGGLVAGSVTRAARRAG